MTNEVLLENSTFRSNRAFTMTNPINHDDNITFDINGGAIFSEGSLFLELENCYFYENECPGHGGSLYLTGDTELIIKNSEFENNACLGSGGSIFLTVCIFFL